MKTQRQVIENVPVAKWEATVSVEGRGQNRKDFRRKVATNGVRRIKSEAIEKALKLLRQGYEVRISADGVSEGLRLFPCLTADYKTMYVAAQTMGGFRTSLGDIKFHMERRRRSNKPKAVDAEELEAERAERIKSIDKLKSEMINVSPDTIITCPTCGTTIRVGRMLK